MSQAAAKADEYGMSFLIIGFSQVEHRARFAKLDNTGGAVFLDDLTGPAADRISALTMLGSIGEPAKSLVKDKVVWPIFTKTAVKHADAVHATAAAAAAAAADAAAAQVCHC